MYYDDLPKRIRIRAVYWKVELVDTLKDDEGEYWGECDSADLAIRLVKDQKDSGMAVDSVLHEITHAICKHGGFVKGDGEERVCSIFATTWAQIFRDNPALLVWIQNTLTGEPGKKFSGC